MRQRLNVGQSDVVLTARLGEKAADVGSRDRVIAARDVARRRLRRAESLRRRVDVTLTTQDGGRDDRVYRVLTRPSVLERLYDGNGLARLFLPSHQLSHSAFRQHRLLTVRQPSAVLENGGGCFVLRPNSLFRTGGHRLLTPEQVHVALHRREQRWLRVIHIRRHLKVSKRKRRCRHAQTSG